MAAILDAILNISISPTMPRWHHSVSMYGHIGEHIYAKTFCADYFFGLHPKSSFGNRTTTCNIKLKLFNITWFDLAQYVQRCPRMFRCWQQITHPFSFSSFVCVSVRPPACLHILCGIVSLSVCMFSFSSFIHPIVRTSYRLLSV